MLKKAARGHSGSRCGRLGLFLTLFVVLLMGGLALGGTGVAARMPPPQPADTLRVVTKPLEPFVIMGEDGDLSGFSVDLWAAIAAELALDYEWVYVEKVTDQLQAVQEGRAEVAIAGISMTPEREQLVDFTHPYFNAGLRILTRGQAAGTSVFSIITNVFSPALLQVLGIGLLTLVVMAHVIWLVERGGNEAMPRAYLPGIWESLWWSLSTIATFEYGDREKPRALVKRLLAMFWVVLSIILIAQFTAAVTASLTVKQLTAGIGGPDDLPGKRIATVTGSTAATFLEENGFAYTPVARIEDAYPLLVQSRVDAIVYDSPVLIYYAQNKGKGLVQVAGPIFKAETYGIALPAGSPLRKPINATILELRRDGTYDELYEKWFGSVR